MTELPYLALVKAFLQALSDGKTGAALAEFYHPEVKQTEYPNLLTKAVTERGLEDLKSASEKGRQVIRKQNFELVRSYSAGDAVIVEAVWTAELAIPLGKLPVGGEMKAWFAQFYEFKDGKIVAQRNYDCFETFL